MPYTPGAAGSEQSCVVCAGLILQKCFLLLGSWKGANPFGICSASPVMSLARPALLLGVTHHELWRAGYR